MPLRRIYGRDYASTWREGGAVALSSAVEAPSTGDASNVPVQSPTASIAFPQGAYHDIARCKRSPHRGSCFFVSFPLPAAAHESTVDGREISDISIMYVLFAAALFRRSGGRGRTLIFGEAMVRSFAQLRSCFSARLLKAVVYPPREAAADVLFLRI